MRRIRKPKESADQLIIKCIGGVLLLIFFFAPHAGEMLLGILALGLVCAVTYLIAKHIAKKEKQHTQIYAGIRPLAVHRDGLADALKTAEDAGVYVKQTPKAEKPTPRYTTADSLITKGEKQFYDVLKRAVPEAAIHTKVRVSDVIQHTTGFIGDFRRVSQFHFDWVICDPRTYKPILAVELDDSSHRQWRNKRNDETKDQAAKEANFPILRFPWARTYNENEIRNKIAVVVNRSADEAEKRKGNSDTKKCPRCKGVIIERIAKATGNKFLGCSEFPKCRYVVKIN
jgi:very-short-patch-repair endonuclease